MEDADVRVSDEADGDWGEAGICACVCVCVCVGETWNRRGVAPEALEATEDREAECCVHSDICDRRAEAPEPCDSDDDADDEDDDEDGEEMMEMMEARDEAPTAAASSRSPSSLPERYS